jgi:hypothetical protein
MAGFGIIGIKSLSCCGIQLISYDVSPKLCFQYQIPIQTEIYNTLRSTKTNIPIINPY